jgi:hypothetical protein
MTARFAVRLLFVLLGAAVSLAGCGKDSSSATTTSPTQTPADASITENFSAALTVGGAVFYSFNFVQYGNVAITLRGISGPNLPDGLTLSVGIGRPSGTGCTTSTSVSATPGDTAHVTGTYGPGIYCVRVFDSGTLSGPVTVSVSVAHS